MTNPFNVVQEQRAAVNVWKFTDQRRANEDNPMWTKKRADGTYSFIGTVTASTSVEFQGLTVTADMMVDSAVEFRLNAADAETLLECAEHIEGRLVDVHVKVTSMAIKKLTVNGKPANSIVLFAELVDAHAAPTRLQSDNFGGDLESLKAFFNGNKQQAAAQRESAMGNLMNNAATAGKPTANDVAASLG